MQTNKIILDYLETKESEYKNERNYWASQYHSLTSIGMVNDLVKEKITQAADNIGHLNSVLIEINVMITDLKNKIHF